MLLGSFLKTIAVILLVMIKSSGDCLIVHIHVLHLFMFPNLLIIHIATQLSMAALWVETA